MESCLGVEQDLDKALSKFNGLSEHATRVLSDSIKQIEELKREIAAIDPNSPLSEHQKEIVKEATYRIKEAMHNLAAEHRDLHSSVSRVGKSLDRHFICDFGAVAPKAESFCSDANKPILEQAVAQHLYRQGLDDIADTFVSEAHVEGVERRSKFAVVERIAAALCAGDAAPAIQWVQERQDELMHSPLPFTLHTMHALQLAREEGVISAINYAREHFPCHAARHEKQLQEAVCALAWVAPAQRPDGKPAPPPPPQYRHLLANKGLGSSVAEMFVREACALLRLAPHSALAGAVRAGCRVLPPLHDIRSKVTQPHVIAAWADDELPLEEQVIMRRFRKLCDIMVADELVIEVDLGDDGSSYHSVFACPILRQQATEQNPPMRLLCGHVISRDALNKLAQGVKLKCPYCPMEQSPSEARQIYFA